MVRKVTMGISYKIYLLFLLIVATGLASASECPVERPDYFCRTAEDYSDSLVTEEQFYLVPVKIYSLFQLELLTLPFPFLFDFQWKSPFFGAGISHHENQYKMMLLGGTTRLKDFSLDAYAAVVCHEFGHLLGGKPFQTIPGAQWASAEGQADYFAASRCLPKYFASLGLSSQDIPLRIEKAGYDMIQSFMEIEQNSNEKPIRYLKNAKAVGRTLINQYPSLACRYETFLFFEKRQDCWFVE